jgi:Xaa-Pro aminopeptidase
MTAPRDGDIGRASGQERLDEVSAKLARVRVYLTGASLDGVLLSRRNAFAWLTAGGDNHVVATSEDGVATLLVTRDAVRVIATNIEMSRLLDEELSGLDVDPVVMPWHENGLRGLSGAVGNLRVASDAPLPGIPLLGVEFARLRFALLPSEAARYRGIGRRTVEAVEEVTRGARPGDPEMVLAGGLSAALMARGLTPTVLLVACDERIRGYRHPVPTGARLTRQAMLVVMAASGGMQVALTRLVHFGTPSEELRRRHRAAAAVDAALACASRPGVRAGDALAAGIAAYRREGYPDEWRLHHQGGPTGYAPREYLVTPSSTEVLLENQPIAWNTSITETKSEDTFILTPRGPEYVTLSDRWPTHTIVVDGVAIRRPAILEQ